jgi:hypothetical protein
MRACSALLSVCLLVACGEDPHEHNENEVITTVILTFTPAGGGAAVVAEFDDPDGDGGEAPTVDPVDLTDGTTYALTVGFENRLEDPPEVITEEVADESDQHQIFLTGSAVDGPASDNPGAPLTHTYDDEDANGLPIGLENTIVAAAGTGELTITLRHLPPVNDVAVKTAELAAEVADGGFAAIGGSSDAEVDFDATVQ